MTTKTTTTTNQSSNRYGTECGYRLFLAEQEIEHLKKQIKMMEEKNHNDHNNNEREPKDYYER